MSKYRIGDFARMLGVSTDLIKHYERYGIIQGEKVGYGNYRYYYFWQSPNIIYSRQLQNMGLTLKEISRLINNGTVDDYFRSIKEQKEKLEEEIAFKNQVINEIEEMLIYCREIAAGDFDGKWWIRETKPFYFFSHSYGHHFLPEVKEMEDVSKWMDHMPMTRMMARIYSEGGCGFDTLVHGFYVPPELVTLKAFQKEEVDYVPAKKCLIYQSSMDIRKRDVKLLIGAMLEGPLALAVKHRFQFEGDVYSRTLMQAREDGREKIFRILEIPLLD